MDLDLVGDGGVRLRATREPGAGPLVLLLHGLVSQRLTWGPVLRRLGDIDVLALDQRGHGESDAPETGYDPATCAADAAQVLEQVLDTDSRAVVVGHSWGAAVAAELAATRADLVASLVLLDGGVVPLERMGSREQVRSVMEPAPMAMAPPDLERVFANGPLSAWWTDEVRDAVVPCFREDDDGLWRRRLAYEHHMQIIDGMLDQDVEATLKACQMPSWVAVCEAVPGRGSGSRFDDPTWAAVRETAVQRVAEVMGDPRILRLAGAVHDVHLQWPWLVAGLIRSAHDEAVRVWAGRGDA